ncbi:JAB domain-containing protein [Sorangium sp. So ce281]|uniref:JAB domain-containing protein n=1 Tax=Sorangium sp. So ce281 TaxID=3133293 RepID=UPI003F5DE594
MNPRSSKRQRSDPSGAPTPTREDEAMTLELRHLGSELQVPLTAHVIVTPSGRYAAVHEVALAPCSAPPPARCAPAHPARHLPRTAPAGSSASPGSGRGAGARGATDRGLASPSSVRSLRACAPPVGVGHRRRRGISSPMRKRTCAASEPRGTVPP